MRRAFIMLIILCLSALWTAGMPAAAQDATPAAPTPTVGAAATPREIFIALVLGDPIFTPPLWRAAAEERPDRTVASWRADDIGALAFLEYLHISAETKTEEIRGLFDEAWFASVFGNYTNVETTAACGLEDDVYLWEFKAAANEIQYSIRYWVQRINDTRLMAIFIAFPAVDAANLDTYSTLLFPLIATCEV